MLFGYLFPWDLKVATTLLSYQILFIPVGKVMLNFDYTGL